MRIANRAQFWVCLHRGSASDDMVWDCTLMGDEKEVFVDVIGAGQNQGWICSRRLIQILKIRIS